jgi:predicted methyltransferase
MYRSTVSISLSFAAAAIATSIGLSAADSPPVYIEAAVTSVGRPPDDMARDADRKPAETVAFAGVKTGDKVLELVPARGYYTRILSKVIGSKGKLYAVAFGRPPSAATPPPAGAPPNPIDSVYRLSRSTEFDNIMPILGVTMGGASNVGLPEQVDVVWTSDNYHDFHNNSFGPLDLAKFNRSIFRDLKPGGVYLIIDHATAAGAGATQTETLHRIDPETVKQEVLAAGFVLDGESNMLAHPGDDHTQAVFKLQGKEDDFVLRFRKPRRAEAARRLPDSEVQPYYGNTLVLGTPDRRIRTIFYHPDHTYQEFGGDGITNGIWYLDIDGNNCMVHQTERAGAEGTVACRPLDFPARKQPHVGDAIAGERPGMMDVALMKGFVYPNAPMTPPGVIPAPASTPSPATLPNPRS